MFRNLFRIIILSNFVSSCAFFEAIDMHSYMSSNEGGRLPSIPANEIDPEGVRSILAGLCVEDITILDAEIYKDFKSRDIGDLLTRKSAIQRDDKLGAPILCRDFIRCLTPTARDLISAGRFPYAAFYNHLILGKDLHRYTRYDIGMMGRLSIASDLAHCSPSENAS